MFSYEYWSLLFTDSSFGSKRSEMMMCLLQQTTPSQTGREYEVGIQPVGADEPEVFEVHKGEDAEVTSLFTLSQTVSWAAMDAPSCGVSAAVTRLLWTFAEQLSRGVQSGSKADFDITINRIHYWRKRVWNPPKLPDTQGGEAVVPDS